MTCVPRLRVVRVQAPRRKPVWWIEGFEYRVDDRIYTRLGPYDTCAEAMEDCHGLQQTFNTEFTSNITPIEEQNHERE